MSTLSPAAINSQLGRLIAAGKVSLQEAAPDDMAAWWQMHIPHASPDETYAQLTEGLSDARLSITPWNQYVRVLASPFESALIKLDFSTRPRIMSVELAPGAQRTQLGRKLLSNVLELCKQHNNTPLCLTAIDMGAYAWAKCGFLPDEASWEKLRHDIDRRLHHKELWSQLGRREKQVAESILNSDDPTGIWMISDLQTKVRAPACTLRWLQGEEHECTSLGKALLIGQTWEGELNPAHDKSIARFNAYVGRMSGPHLAAVAAHAAAVQHGASPV